MDVEEVTARVDPRGEGDVAEGEAEAGSVGGWVNETGLKVVEPGEDWFDRLCALLAKQYGAPSPWELYQEQLLTANKAKEKRAKQNKKT